MKKGILKLILFVIIFFAPFLIFFIISEKTKDQYNNTYLAEMKDKCDLLTSTDDKKIIFVGGSSLPFGLRSDLIENELSDYKVIDFGLYATLGTKFMMDMSKLNINAGDIVVLSPELSQQTYSLYFNPTAVLEAMDGYSSYIGHLSLKDKQKLFYNYFDFSKNKLKYFTNGNAPNPVGIYRHDSFNSYGDICVERPNNIMNNMYDQTMDIVIDENLLSRSFIKYVNEYCNYVRKRKAKIYFSFSPNNELAVKSSKAKRSFFQEKLSSNLTCDLLINIDDSIIDSGYFYDTNFHLNSSGAIYYSSILVKALKNKLNVLNSDEGNYSLGGIDIPNPPSSLPEEPVVVVPDTTTKTAFEDYNGEPNNDYVDCFEYRLVGSSYQIIGIRDEYKDIEEIILPSTYDSKNITTIKENCLYGCTKLKKIHIGLTYKTFEKKSFNGCISLLNIYLYELEGNKLTPSPLGLLDGACRNVKICIPDGANYEFGYTWSNYSDAIIHFSKE